MNYSSCEQIRTYADYLEVYDELSKLLLNLNNNLTISEKCSLMIGNFMHDNNLTKEVAIKSIIEYFKNLQSVEVKISFDPSVEFLEKLYLIIFQYINKHFFLKYEVDPAQFLGATISYQGKIYKQSFI